MLDVETKLSAVVRVILRSAASMKAQNSRGLQKGRDGQRKPWNLTEFMESIEFMEPRKGRSVRCFRGFCIQHSVDGVQEVGGSNPLATTIRLDVTISYVEPFLFERGETKFSGGDSAKSTRHVMKLQECRV